MNYVMRAIWARVMKLGGYGPWGPMATRLYGYGYWLCGHEYMNIDYGYWLWDLISTIGYGYGYWLLVMGI